MDVPNGSFGRRISGGEQERVVDRVTLEIYDDDQLNEKFERMLTDMNLAEEKKTPLRNYHRQQKIAMLLAYRRINSQERRSKYEKPSDYIYHLVKSDITVDNLIEALRNLRISLTNNTLTWIEEFGENGVQKLVARLKDSQRRDDRYVIVESECVRCLNAIMNNALGIQLIFACRDVFPALAQSLNTSRQSAMLEAVKILSATCLKPDGVDKVMEAIIMAGEISGKGRFVPIVDGLKSGCESLMIACMQLINAIISVPDDLDLRMHLRNEFMRSGLYDVIEDLRCDEPLMEIQLAAFDASAEDDHDEFLQKYDNIT